MHTRRAVFRDMKSICFNWSEPLGGTVRPNFTESEFGLKRQLYSIFNQLQNIHGALLLSLLILNLQHYTQLRVDSRGPAGGAGLPGGANRVKTR